MKDRVVQYPHRYRLMPVSGQEGVYDIVAASGTVTEEGTAINKANLLSDETAAALGLSDPVPDEAVVELLNRTFGSTGFYNSDFYLYITGRHPFLNADAMLTSDYGAACRSINLSGNAETINVKDDIWGVR